MLLLIWYIRYIFAILYKLNKKIIFTSSKIKNETMKKLLSMSFYIALVYFFIALYSKTYNPMMFPQENIATFAVLTFLIIMSHE